MIDIVFIIIMLDLLTGIFDEQINPQTNFNYHDGHLHGMLKSQNNSQSIFTYLSDNLTTIFKQHKLTYQIVSGYYDRHVFLNGITYIIIYNYFGSPIRDQLRLEIV